MEQLLWVIPAFPLLGFVLLVLGGRRLGEPLAGWFATAMVASSFVATVAVFFGLSDLDAGERVYEITLFEWVPSGELSVSFGLLGDPLSITLALFITGISAFIHMYAVGYMHGDENFSKFFVYLNLFVFSMLMLVLSDNLLLTFLGWEGVGACSYLLISFWFSDEANATAGKKAFITNRVGDLGFMLAMFLVFFTVGSLNYSDIFSPFQCFPNLGKFNKCYFAQFIDCILSYTQNESTLDIDYPFVLFRVFQCIRIHTLSPIKFM